MLIKYYSFNKIAGCVKQWVNNKKQSVGVYNSEQQGLGSDEGRWSVICEKHGTFVSCHSLKVAFHIAINTDFFCDECRKQLQKINKEKINVK